MSHIPHDPLSVCQYCGCYFHMSQLKPEYNGIMACEQDWSPKHPKLTILRIDSSVELKWRKGALPEPPYN